MLTVAVDVEQPTKPAITAPAIRLLNIVFFTFTSPKYIKILSSRFGQTY